MQKILWIRKVKEQEQGITLGLFCENGYKGFHWHCPLKHLSSSMIEGTAK